ncbi:MAG: hypothetical protein ACRDNS_04005 [Trebonia sp.]
MTEGAPVTNMLPVKELGMPVRPGHPEGVMTDAAEPSRAARIATLWGRITRSAQVVGRDDGSVPVPADSLTFARTLLSELAGDLELPQASVSQDGELILTWFRNRDCLSATLEPDRYLTWAFRIGGSLMDGDVIAFSDAVGRHRFHDAVAQFYG